MDSTESQVSAAPQTPATAEALGKEEPAAAAKPPVAVAPASPRGFLEWFTRRKTLAATRAKLRPVVLAEQERLTRATIAAELADRALDPIDPLRSGSGAGPALSLYREAAYFAILGQSEAIKASDLAEAMRVAPEELLSFAAGGTDGLTQIRKILVEKSFVDTAEEPVERIEQQARLAKDFVYALLNLKLGPAREEARLLAQRWLRIVLVLLLLGGAVVGTSIGLSRALRGPDLAAGKPWVASSKFVPCFPQEHRCGEARTDIFFHTNEEDRPWLRIDLQKPTAFSVVEVVNRQDCCPDRAFPLVIEVSQDDKSWREVARQPQSFDEWRAELTPVTARYVRVKALKKTWLHLERVSVRTR